MQKIKKKISQAIAWVKAKKIRMVAAAGVLVVVIGGTGYAITRPTSQPADTRTEETTQSAQTISIESEPASAQIETTACGVKEPKQTTPFTCKAQLGEEISLSAIASYTHEGSTYTFDKWEGCNRTEGSTCYITVSDTTPYAKAIYKKEAAKSPTPASKPKTSQSQPVNPCSNPEVLGGYRLCTITITSAPTNYTLKISYSGPKSQKPVNQPDWYTSNIECSPNFCQQTPIQGNILVTAERPTKLKIRADDYIHSWECVGIGCTHQPPVDQFRYAGFGYESATRTIILNYEFMCNWSGEPAPNCNSL